MSHDYKNKRKNFTKTYFVIFQKFFSKVLQKRKKHK